MWNNTTLPLPYPEQITVKNSSSLPISIPKADLYNVNAHSKFGENPLIFTQVIVWKQKIKMCLADNCQN